VPGRKRNEHLRKRKVRCFAKRIGERGQVREEPLNRWKGVKVAHIWMVGWGKDREVDWERATKWHQGNDSRKPLVAWNLRRKVQRRFARGTSAISDVLVTEEKNTMKA